MGFNLEKVIPWGRSMREYIQMFDLTLEELKLNILDCGGSPASFNAEMTRQVPSCQRSTHFSTIKDIQ